MNYPQEDVLEVVQIDDFIPDVCTVSPETIAVSKQIVRLHGGTLRLSHNSEEKVTFLIVLE